MKLSALTLSAIAVVPVGLLGVEIMGPQTEFHDAFSVNVLVEGRALNPMGLEFVADKSRLLVTAAGYDCVRVVGQDGGVGTLCDTLGEYPVGVHNGEGPFSGSFYVAGAVAGGIEEVDAFGNTQTFALGEMGISDIHFAPGLARRAYDLYALEWSTGNIWRVDKDGTATAFAALPLGGRPQYRAGKLEFSTEGPFGTYLYVSEMSTGDIWRIGSDGVPAVFASTGTPGIEGMAFSPGGAFGKYLYVGNSSTGQIVRVAPDGTVTPWTGRFRGVADIEFGTDGGGGYRMFVADGLVTVYVIEA